MRERLLCPLLCGLEGELSNGNTDADPPHCYPVGLDRLFTVSLPKMILTPAFWNGTPVRVLLTHWFYAPPSSSSASASSASHMMKPFPVDPELCASLDRAYSTIRPWDDSYDHELSAALKGGAEAQKRLCVSLGVGNESGVDPGAGAGIEVIFQSATEGRVYSKGFLGSMGKSFWSNGKGLGGGQVVLRGWDAMRTYHARKNAQKHKKTASVPDSAIDTSDGESVTSSKDPRSRHGSSSSTTKGAFAPSTDSGFFSSLKSKIYGAPAAAEQEEPEQGESSNERANETAEAMAGPRNKEGDKGVGEVGEVDELIIVCHGIGQKVRRRLKSLVRKQAADPRSRSSLVPTSLSTSSMLSTSSEVVSGSLFSEDTSAHSSPGQPARLSQPRPLSLLSCTRSGLRSLRSSGAPISTSITRSTTATTRMMSTSAIASAWTTSRSRARSLSFVKSFLVWC